MGVKVYAAIDIGSYELMMKIYELGKADKFKLIDCIRYKMDLGRDTYSFGKISYEKLNLLCDTLIRFQEIMKSYRVEDYRICTTSAIRECSNPEMILDQIRIKTGMKVDILSNSEQRLLEYKALETKKDIFNSMIRKKTAVADIGGGSLQISLFANDRLTATENMRLGAVRIRERLEDASYRSTKYISMIEDLIENDLEAFDRLYVQGKEIKNIIVMGDVCSRMLRGIGNGKDIITRKSYLDFYEKWISKSAEKIVAHLGIPLDHSRLIYPFMVLLKSIVLRTEIETIWAPEVHLCDGAAYEYGVEKKYIKETHNFEEDILAAANRISKRYKCNQVHVEKVISYALNIFDAMKKQHGLGKRERLLLEIIAMIHDCGKYISLSYAPQSAYNIVMSTEMIGLSHMERQIIANTILYNTLEMKNQGELLESVGEKAFITICKLTAILKIANGLDRSHKQKISKLKSVCKEGILTITVSTCEDMTLERQIFESSVSYFEEIFGIRPVLNVRALPYGTIK